MDTHLLTFRVEGHFELADNDVSCIEQCSFLRINMNNMCLKIFNNVIIDNKCISFPVSLFL